MTEFGHTRSCPALNPYEDCICGLAYRIQLQTEQEMHNAWRKRAEEAELRAAASQAALLEIMDLVQELPSGIDEQADTADTSPKDMAAHIGGLIWQMCEQPNDALREFVEDIAPLVIPHHVLAGYARGYNTCRAELLANLKERLK